MVNCTPSFVRCQELKRCKVRRPLTPSKESLRPIRASDSWSGKNRQAPYPHINLQIHLGVLFVSSPFVSGSNSILVLNDLQLVLLRIQPVAVHLHGDGDTDVNITFFFGFILFFRSNHLSSNARISFRRPAQ